MPFFLKVMPLMPAGLIEEHPIVDGVVIHHCDGAKDPKKACPLMTGFWHHGVRVAAGWDDENRRQIGWVVRAGAEKYGREHISNMGHTWEVEEDE